jgi:hypothetical protein
MKKQLLFLFVLLLGLSSIMAQSPNQFNYQTALRDASGNVLANQNVTIDIEIKEAAPTGNVVFSESHNITTNAQGIANFMIGDTNDLSTVDFSNGSKYYVTTKLNSVEIGTMQMLSVPFALNSNGLTLTSPDGKVYKASVTSSGKVVFHMADDETTARQKMVERLQEILDNLQVTGYTHTNGAVMDEANGIYKYDCSGFICEFAMKDVLPNHYADMYVQYHDLHDTDIRPRAWTFYDYFRNILGPSYNADIASTCTAQNAYWKVFTSIDSIKKGDIMVVKYNQSWRDWYYNTHSRNASTGHVMTVWGPAVRVSDDVHSPEYRQFDIQILDATLSGHANDSRDNSPASIDGSGIGYGWMRIKVSNRVSRRPFEYKWKPTSSNWYEMYDSGTTTTDYTRIKGILFARYIGN